MSYPADYDAVFPRGYGCRHCEPANPDAADGRCRGCSPRPRYGLPALRSALIHYGECGVIPPAKGEV